MTWQVTSIPVESLRPVWPMVAPLLAPAVARTTGRLTMRKAFEGLHESRYLLWVARQEDMVVHAAFLTRVAVYPSRSMLAVDLAGGAEMTGWLEAVVATFRSFAAETGLDGVEMVGRPGWGKALGRLGWLTTGVLMETGV